MARQQPRRLPGPLAAVLACALLYSLGAFSGLGDQDEGCNDHMPADHNGRVRRTALPVPRSSLVSGSVFAHPAAKPEEEQADDKRDAADDGDKAQQFERIAKRSA